MEHEPPVSIVCILFSYISLSCSIDISYQNFFQYRTVIVSILLPVLTITGFGDTKFSNTFLNSRYKSGVAEVAVLNLQFLLDGQIFFSYFIVGKFSDIVDCHNFNMFKKSWFYDIISIACAISF